MLCFIFICVIIKIDHLYLLYIYVSFNKFTKCYWSVHYTLCSNRFKNPICFINMIYIIKQKIFVFDHTKHLNFGKFYWAVQYTLCHNRLKILFVSIGIKSLYFITIRISLQHTLNIFVPCGYVESPSNICNLLSLLLLRAIVLVFTVYSSWWSLLNTCYGLSIVLLLNKQFV